MGREPDRGDRRISRRAVEIQTPDGVADAVLAYPADSGRWPGVIFYPDALGLRATKVEMAERLASDGFVVLAVNQFYRKRRAPVVGKDFSFSSESDKAYLTTLIESVGHDTNSRDALAFADFLQAQGEVDTDRSLGAVGYCIGGPATIQAAAVLRDRLGAAVSFHGTGLVIEDSDVSPHRLIAGTTAVYHIGIADNDDRKEPHVSGELEAAFREAGLSATVEVYKGSNHGWTVPDSVAFDPTQAERAWQALLLALSAGLKRKS